MHQAEWEEISRRHRLTTLGDGHPATFESTAIPNTAPLIHVSKGTAASGSDNVPEAGDQPPLGLGGSSSEDDNMFTVPVSQSIPTHSTNVRDLKLILQHFLTFYTINAVREYLARKLIIVIISFLSRHYIIFIFTCCCWLNTQSAEVTNYADELQLYYHTTKKFRNIYQKQEHQLNCPTYGSPLEVWQIYLTHC